MPIKTNSKTKRQTKQKKRQKMDIKSGLKSSIENFPKHGCKMAPVSQNLAKSWVKNCSKNYSNFHFSGVDQVV